MHLKSSDTMDSIIVNTIYDFIQVSNCLKQPTGVYTFTK